jgi:hypothetical protein
MELGWSPGRLCGAPAYRKADAKARAPEPLRNIATARPSVCDRSERLSRKFQLRDLGPRRRGAPDFGARKRRGLLYSRLDESGRSCDEPSKPLLLLPPLSPRRCGSLLAPPWRSAFRRQDITSALARPRKRRRKSRWLCLSWKHATLVENVEWSGPV